MTSSIRQIKLYRTLDTTNREKYYDKYFRLISSNTPQDVNIILNNSDLLKFLKVNFSFSNPKIINNLFIIPDFKILIDNNNILGQTLLLHSRLTDGEWKRINILDLIDPDLPGEPFIYLKLFKDITAKMSKSLMLSDIYHKMAKEYAALGTCNRLSVGALIIKDGRIISTGTNGSIQGLPSCKDDGCLLDHGHCIRTIHGEQNAILFCSREGIEIKGSTMYCTDMPCIRCLGMIAQSGIKAIYYERDYNDGFNKKLEKQLENRIEFYKYDGSMYRLSNPRI